MARPTSRPGMQACLLALLVMALLCAVAPTQARCAHVLLPLENRYPPAPLSHTLQRGTS